MRRCSPAARCAMLVTDDFEQPVLMLHDRNLPAAD
jgi:hypothetical protein